MSPPLVRVAPVRLWVGDTGPLMQEAVQGARRGELTSMLAALEHDTARLYVARHVLTEVERDLPVYARDRGVDPARAVAWWRLFYLPHIRVVDVRENWGQQDPRVASVAARHPVDLPTARLAGALAPCHALIEDPDLADYGFGTRPEPDSRNSNWLALAHGSANQVQIDLAGGVVWIPSALGWELAKGAVRVVARLPVWAQLALSFAVGAVLYWWQSSGRAAQQVSRARSVARRVGDAVLPIAEVVLERALAAQETWRSDVVASGPVSLSERIARRLALADGPMTAAELARLIDWPGTLRTRETAIRGQLRTCSAFVQTSCGRWRLGEPASDQDSAVTELQIVDWLRRAHRRPPLTTSWL